MTLLIKETKDLDFIPLRDLPYKDEGELRKVFIDTFPLILADIETVESKSFIFEEFENVDLVLVGNDGSIFLAETKLARNSAARRVLSQILDYCVNFHYDGFVSFENKWKRRYNKTSFLKSLNESFENGQDVYENLKKNWNNGNFNLLIIMDSIDTQIEKMGDLLRKHNFFVYGVALKRYLHKTQEILSPKIFWGELIQKSDTYQKQLLEDSEFIKSCKNTTQIRDFVSLFNDIENSTKQINAVIAKKTPKYLNFLISDGLLSASLHIDPSEGGGIQFWCKQIAEDKARPILMHHGVTLLKPLKSEFGKVGKWDLKHFSKENFESLLTELSTI